MIRVICFDLDGTLTPTTHHYDIARWRCGTVIAESLQEHCPKAEQILKIQQDIDQAMVPEWGYSLERFPTSWTRVYEAMAREAGQLVNPVVAQKLYHLASGFRHTPFVLYEGVREMLAGLTRRYELHLVTLGDRTFQLKKIHDLGIADCFATIQPVQDHKEDALAKVFKNRADESVMVGDGRTSDLGPAQRLGAKTIWVKQPNTWELHDGDQVIPDLTINHIQDLPAAIDQLNAPLHRP